MTIKHVSIGYIPNSVPNSVFEINCRRIICPKMTIFFLPFQIVFQTSAPFQRQHNTRKCWQSEAIVSTGFTVWHKIVPDFNHTKVHVIINIDSTVQYNKLLCCHRQIQVAYRFHDEKSGYGMESISPASYVLYNREYRCHRHTHATAHFTRATKTSASKLEVRPYSRW